MVIDVAAHISLLLYQNDAVVLPGLGKLSSTYKPAALDHIQGQLLPPAKTIHFEVDDSVQNDLIQRSLAERHHINATQAEILLEDYIHSVRNALSYEEEVDIPKVGKLYKGYDQKLCFAAYDTNYNSTSFGLPQLQYRAIERTSESRKLVNMDSTPNVQKVVVPEQTDINLPPLPPSPLPNRGRKSSSKLIWLVPLLLGILVIYLGFRWYTAKQQLQAEKDRLQAAALVEQQPPMDLGNKSVEQDNVLEKNDLERNPADHLTIVPEAAPSEVPSVPATATPDTPVEPKEAVKPKAAKSEKQGRRLKQCIVISGVFKSAENQQKMAKTLADRGFEVYKDQKKGLFRVGVQFDYNNTADLAANINSIKNFAPGSWVFKK